MADQKVGMISKLSKHVLGMKFMRKSREQFEEGKIIQTHRRHFGTTWKTDSIRAQNGTLKSDIKETFEVKEIPSFYQIDRYSFGRVSYGGFNPEVEANIKKGLWRSEITPELNNFIKEEEEAEIKTEYDVTDVEMAERTYGSLVATVGKHFTTKRERQEADNNERDGLNFKDMRNKYDTLKRKGKEFFSKTQKYDVAEAQSEKPMTNRQRKRNYFKQKYQNMSNSQMDNQNDQEPGPSTKKRKYK